MHSNNFIKDVVMPAPNAASLGKYGDIPVDLSKGTASIEIPLYTIQEQGLNLPISLSYHSSGIKVAEPSSWVGAGWSLNAGGIITRTVLGLPDDEPVHGYFYCTTDQGKNPHLLELLLADNEPDLFTYNIGGYSGKFIINKSGQCIQIAKSDVKIIRILGGDGELSFKIIAPSGIQYLFNTEYEKTKVLDKDFATNNKYQEYVSTWYLKKMQTYDEKFYIEFGYASENYGITIIPSCSEITTVQNSTGHPSLNSFGCNSYDLIPRMTEIYGKRLESITTSTYTNSIYFSAGSVRQDIEPNFNNQNTARRLDSIDISSPGYCKRFNLVYDYFEDDKPSLGPLNKKLKLEKIGEKSCDDAVKIPFYEFTYEGPNAASGKQFLPNRRSKAIDHWGFYNGQTSNDNLIFYAGRSVIQIDEYIRIFDGGAKRESEEMFMKYGSLKKIKYPTGGETSFEFEANRAYVIYPNPNIDVDKPVTIENCTPTYATGTCCGEITQSQQYTFSSEERSDAKLYCDLYDITFFPETRYDPCYSGSNLYNIEYEIEVRRASDNFFVGSYSFNMVGSNDPYSPYPKEEHIEIDFSDLEDYDVIAATVTYNFILKIKDGVGKFRVEVPKIENPQKVVGGLRIKKITNSDAPTNATPVIKEYTYNLANGKSSGTLTSYPAYVTHFKNQYLFVLFYDSYSIVPLGDFNGYHIGYTLVEEILPNNGKKTYEFFRETNVQLGFPAGFPYEPLPPTITDGKLKKAKTFLQNGQLLSEEENVPHPGGLNYISTGVSATRYRKLVENIPPTEIDGNEYGGWAQNEYSIYQTFYRVQTEKKTIDGVYNETNFFYNSSLLHTQPEAITVTNSNNVTTITNHSYPYSLATGPVRDSLLNRNIIMPLETSITVGGNQVDGTRVEYSLYNSSGVPTTTTTSGQHIYPWKHYRYEATFDNNGYIASGAAWVLKGTLSKVHSSTGLPWEFNIEGWADNEIYEWETNGLIKKRKYRDFVTEYSYYTDTRLLSSIKNIDGQVVNYTYDKLMRLKTASARGGKAVTTYDYSYRTVSYPYNTVKASTAFTSVSGSFLTTKATAQLLDGLGRPIQDIKIQHHPTKGQDGATYGAVDVVVKYDYDAQGRMYRQSLPYASPNTNGTYYAPPGGTKYTVSTFETSPLNRTLSVTPPDWYATTTVYGTNAANEVLIPGTTSSYFAAGTLFKITITDPDNRVSITYTDKKGRLILKRQTDTGNTNPANTYYQYDNKDRVIRVMPPGVAAATTDLVFAYEYDAKDRMTRKKVPDMGSIKMRYNDRDQLVLVQDSMQTGASRSLGTRYDRYGRPVESGFVSGLPGNPNDSLIFTTSLTKTWYDGYDGSTYVNLNNKPQYRGKVRRSDTRLLDGNNNWLSKVIDYDRYGRDSLINGNNHLNLNTSNAEVVALTYDWADNVMTENRTHTPGSAGATGTFSINNSYRYDNAGRRMDFITTIGGIGQHVAEYNYNHRDELIEKNLHANQVAGAWGWLQSVDYSYNAQGWLTGINNWNPSATINTPALCTPAMPNPASPARSTYNEASDLFMLDLRYDQPATGISGLTAAPAQKAGNISQIVYRVRGRESSIVSYSYDYLSRLSTSTFHNYSDAGVISGTNNYNENLTYDLRGNIQTLQRTGFYQNGGTCTYGQIDNLTYSYSPNTNRLHKVLDGTVTAGDAKSRGFNGNLSTADNSMAYDRNGNLNKNLHKNVSTITYNHLNLPTVITFTTGNTIEFLYDAAGMKLRKTVKVGATVQYVQDYLSGGVEYRQNGTGVKRVESVFHAEGRYYNTNVDASNTISWRREYNIKDHLGNTRLVFTDRNANGVVDITGTASTSDVLQENHYYAFGLPFEGAWLQNDAVARDNKYQYNGKEFNDDFGLNWNDYGARWYDASVGRWNGVDPVAYVYYGFSPYNYTLNNPTLFIDPDGRYVIFNGNDDQKKQLQSTLNSYLGVKDIFQIDGAGFLSVGELSDDQKKNLSKEQLAAYGEIKALSGTSFEINFTLIDENTNWSQSDDISGKNVYGDSYNLGLLDVGDVAKMGQDVGRSLVHMLYEQAVGDNPAIFTGSGTKLDYDKAHEMAMANDTRKIGWTYKNDMAGTVNGNYVVYRDAVDKDGKILRSTKITMVSSENQTVLKYETVNRYDTQNQQIIKENNFTKIGKH